jgi:hypothetical protein
MANMERQKFLDTLTQIGTETDEATRRELLATLQTEAGSLYDSNANLTEQNSTLTKNNEDLRSANMKLFLRVGNPNKNEPDGSGEEPPKKRRYEDLFNENGGLK